MPALIAIAVGMLTVPKVYTVVQEYAEQAHMVRQLVIEANTLVQQAPQLQVRLDKDVEKLKVGCCCLKALLWCPVFVLG